MSIFVTMLECHIVLAYDPIKCDVGALITFPNTRIDVLLMRDSVVRRMLCQQSIPWKIYLRKHGEIKITPLNRLYCLYY
jgi:hypothetical protein